ncbi:MAG: aminotransferase class I/II-fold pyridoxal phosphate-dependent enzyme [Desulfovibrionaceae bacterium]
MPRHTVPSEHGGNVFRLARRLGCDPSAILDCSSNSDSLVDHITARITASLAVPYARYPDPASHALCARIAAHEGVDPANILAGNGSSELIHLIFQELRPRATCIVAPVFSEYGLACDRLGLAHRLHVLDEATGFDLTPADADALAASTDDCIVLCVPNNPTGALYTALDALLPRLAARTVIIDTTYREFLHGTPEYTLHRWTRYATAARPGTRVITLGSFTKYFFCTGIRLGWCVADPAVIERLAGARAPWTVWEYAERVGIAFLDAIDEYRAARHGFANLMRELATGLEATGAFSRVLTSRANFLTCKCANPDGAQHLADRLAQQRILVRVCDNIPGMPPGYIRVQVKSAAENRTLVRAIRKG